MVIAIASGKGGTGKTTLAVALSRFAASNGKEVNVFDCDVEEPNTNLFLNAEINEKKKSYSLVPEVNNDLCIGCGKCDEICEFSAIVMVNTKPLVFPDMCHSCGGCMFICPEGAIKEIKKEIGEIEYGTDNNISFTGGRLHIGEAMSPPLIKDVKKYMIKSHLNIIDSPPGTSCPVITSTADADYIILVTEPTPFGLHDLKLAVAMVREIGISFGVVINKSDVGDDRVVEYCKSEDIAILASIPHSKELAEKYSKGEFADFINNKFSQELTAIANSVNIIIEKPTGQ